MRALLVDDEPLALRRLEILLSRRPWVDVVAAVRDGHSATKAARELNPDVVFLDIQMPQLDGFEIASILAQTVRPEIIFVTAYEAHAVKAFEAAAIDYLLKPVEMERLDEALGRARTQLASRDASARADELEALVHTLRGHDGDGHPDLWIRDRNGRVRLEKNRIDWVEAEGDYVRIHSGSRSWLMRATMTAMEKSLDDHQFARVHRSAIVNLRRVARTAATASGGKTLRLDDGTEIRVGRAYETRVNALLARPIS